MGICWTRLQEATGADAVLSSTEALFGLSTESNKASKRPLGKLHKGSCPLCRNPEDPQAQGIVEIGAGGAMGMWS